MSSISFKTTDIYNTSDIDKRHLRFSLWNSSELKKTDDCPICLLTLNDPLHLTSCGHGFHRSCYYQWNRGSCPVCRHPCSVQNTSDINADIQEITLLVSAASVLTDLALLIDAYETLEAHSRQVEQ